jgi:hypothetical protein
LQLLLGIRLIIQLFAEQKPSKSSLFEPTIWTVQWLGNRTTSKWIVNSNHNHSVQVQVVPYVHSAFVIGQQVAQRISELVISVGQLKLHVRVLFAELMMNPIHMIGSSSTQQPLEMNLSKSKQILNQTNSQESALV